MIDQAVETGPLSALAPPLATGTVIRLGDADAVVLTTGGPEIQVWTKDTVTTYAADTAMEPITDPAQTQTVLRQAVLSLNAQRRQAQDALTNLAVQHTTTMEAIRDYAIEAHREGDICEGGLNEFLRTFELDEYDPRVSLSYTMAGSFTVAGTDEDAVRKAAVVLAPDYNYIRTPKEGTPYHHTEIKSMRSAQVSDDQTGFEIGFIITGEYQVRYRDTDDAEANCQLYLRPDLDNIPDVVPGSVSFTVTDIDSGLVY